MTTPPNGPSKRTCPRSHLGVAIAVALLATLPPALTSCQSAPASEASLDRAGAAPREAIGSVGLDRESSRYFEGSGLIDLPADLEAHLAPVGQLWVIADDSRPPERPGEPTEPLDPTDLDAPTPTSLVGGRLDLIGADGEATPIPAERTRISGDVSTPFASWKLEQTFRADSVEARAAHYRVNLPRRSTVEEFVLRLGPEGTGARRIRGVIAPRETAEAIYEEARAHGLRASLTRARRPGEIEVVISRFDRCEELGLELELHSPLVFCQGAWELGLELVGSQVGHVEVDLAIERDAGAPLDAACPALPAGLSLEASGSPSDPRVRLTGRLASKGATSVVVRPRRSNDGRLGHLWIEPIGTGGLFCVECRLPERGEAPASELDLLWLAADGTPAAVSEIYPALPQQVRGGQPIVIVGRYEGSPPAGLVLRSGEAMTRIDLDAPLVRSWVSWVHASQHYSDTVRTEGDARSDLALRHRLLTPWTSIILVDTQSQK